MGRHRHESASILRVSRVVADLDRAMAFYAAALGFEVLGRGAPDAAEMKALGLDPSGAEEARLRLGAEHVCLVAVPDPVARAEAGRCDDLAFQHLALVTSDIDAAYARLGAHAGWLPITTEGPQTLPAENGGVRAFKFRDPDGHPLELIWFPRGVGRPVWREPSTALMLGIDHSAIAVSSSSRTERFYERLGFHIAAVSHNHGPAQARLDAIPGARVTVTGLRPGASPGAGLELLAYHPTGRRDAAASARDVAVDWVTIEASLGPAKPLAMRDPDGHRLVLVQRGTGSPAAGPTT